MKILNDLEKIEQIVQKKEYKSYVESDVSMLKKEYFIEESTEIREALEKMENQERLLKIGIIGRVKAGKSSFIDAIVFDGKDILPKAATPMTAALTQISYGSSLQVEVEFFSQKYISEVKKEYDEYLKKYQEEKKKELQEFKKKKKEIDDSEIEEKAKKKAHRTMKKSYPKISSSYDQYNRMKKSGIDSSSIGERKTIEARDIEDLKSQFETYVGASGKYMPFTKSVHLKIDDKNLKEMEIVDTPGLNDPVVSREERTRRLLKDCDVTFVISPSGQFLNAEDTALMDRISTKEGISEIYVVASQVDNPLSGSNKEKGKGELPKVLDLIKEDLGKILVSVLTTLKKDRPVIRNLFDDLIEQGEKNLLYSSGICQSIKLNFDNKDKLDEGTRHVWNNLKKDYPYAFSDNDKTTSLANLDLLANTEKIKEILKKIRREKDKILEEKQGKYLEQTENKIKEYHQGLIENVKKSLNDLESGSKEKTQKQIENLSKMKKTVEEEINEIFYDRSDEFILDINKDTDNTVKQSINKIIKAISENQEKKTESVYTTERYGFLWLFKKRVLDHSYDYTEVRTGDIISIIKKSQSEVKNDVRIEFYERLIDFKKELKEKISDQFQTLLEKDQTNFLQDISVSKIRTAIRQGTDNIEEPKIEYEDLPGNLDIYRTLRESEAKSFIKEVEKYMEGLEGEIKKSLRDSIKEMKEKIKKTNLTENIFTNYGKELKKLEKQLQNKEKSEKEMKQLIQELEKVNVH